MTLVDKYTVKHYLLHKLTLERNAGIITGYAYVELFNADGESLGHDRIDLGLTTSEQNAIKNRLATRISNFETATGWTPLVDPEP